jgi:FkbM family methyltransferase
LTAANDPSTLILADPLEQDAFNRTSDGIEERSKTSPNCSMKLANLPRVLRRNLETVRLLGNWSAVVGVGLHGKAKTNRLQFRNGVVLQGQASEILEFLFHEVWIDQAYSPPGYEIRRGDTVIDAGANIGAFAMFAATRAPDVKVYSFEPFASNVAWLRKNLADSGLSNVQVFQQAIAGSSGQRPFFIEPGNCMFHSLYCDVASDGSKRLHEMVECTTLDEIFTAHQIKCCHVLKLDCEGAELEILENSSPGTLSRVRKIVGELHGAYKLDSLRQFLESHSFQVEISQSGTFRARNTSALMS